MRHLIDKEKFMMELLKSSLVINKIEIKLGDFKRLMISHTKDIKDEPHHPSGMDNDKIKIRNDLRKELREE